MCKQERSEKLSWSYPTIEGIPNNVYGVYAIWSKTDGKCIYVGHAKEQSIRQRLRQHWNGSHNVKLKSWIKAFGKHLELCYVAFACIEFERISQLEKRLIKAWKPETNKDHNPNYFSN